MLPFVDTNLLSDTENVVSSSRGADSSNSVSCKMQKFNSAMKRTDQVFKER